MTGKPIGFTYLTKSRSTQYAVSILTVLIVAGLGYLLSGVTDYRVTALLLLVSVSLLAMVMRIGPVLVASLLSALVWDFFFIPPKFTFHVGTAEDALLLLMYFVISLLNGVLTLRIRQIDNQHREKQEKENTIKLYNTLLNSLSHELRTPIATIIAATDYLQSKNNSGPDVNSKDLLNEISTASLRLNQQVENLLNMSRLESGFIRAKKDWCDMRELIHATLNKVKQPGVTYNIKVDIADDLPLFKLDYGLTEQVLHNLIVNALAYTPKGTLITIAAYCEYNSCMLSVTDRGNGFPETELENVFDKFYRLDNKSTGGTGLGLSIVKGFTEAQGGTVLLQNMQEGGARFLIELPAETSYINALKNE